MFCLLQGNLQKIARGRKKRKRGNREIVGKKQKEENVKGIGKYRRENDKGKNGT